MVVAGCRGSHIRLNSDVTDGTLAITNLFIGYEEPAVTLDGILQIQASMPIGVLREYLRQMILMPLIM